MLMTAASAWTRTVANQAVPYSALLDSYDILPLANPPNYINLQQQQLVLSQCSLWRDQDLTTLNDIAYINTNPSQFVNDLSRLLKLRTTAGSRPPSRPPTPRAGLVRPYPAAPDLVRATLIAPIWTASRTHMMSGPMKTGADLPAWWFATAKMT